MANDTNQTSGCPPVGIYLEGLLLPPLLIIDVILGIIGNAVAMWIFCRKLKTWNNNTLFLFNLVIADFSVLVSLPLRIDALLRGHWVFGDGLCRINLFLMFANRSASIGLLTILAVYRYFKVVHPHHQFNHMTKRQAWYTLALLWLLVIAPRVPMLAYSYIRGSDAAYQCFFFTSYQEKSRAIIFMVGMHRILTVLEFLIPLAMLFFCSGRISCVLRQRQMSKTPGARRAVRACIVIVVVFMVCFLPSTVTTAGMWVIRSYRPQDCTAFYIFTQITIVSFGLNFLNSALDPIIYCFSSSMFRHALVSSLPPVLRCCGGDAGKGSVAEATSKTQSTSQQEMKPIQVEGGSEEIE